MARKVLIPVIDSQEVRATLKGCKGSVQKVDLVLSLIRGQSVQKAASLLSFCRKRLALPIRKLLMSALSNAENNEALDIDSLYVSEAYSGKAYVLKRWRARAKGRSSRICKFRSNITIVLKQGEESS